MKNKYKKLLFLNLLWMPTLVFASDGNNEFPIGFALAMEAFVSIHMSVFVLKPLAEMFSKESSKKTFWTLFAARAGILIFFDFFVTPFIAIVDFIGVFIGAALIVPICAKITKTRIDGRSNQVIKVTPVTTVIPPSDQVKGVELKCAKCNALLQVTDKFCPSCGEAFNGNNVVVSENVNATIQTSTKVAVLPSNFDNIYRLSEDKMLEEFINRELTKAGIDKSLGLIPSDILKRKKILNIIFSILVFVFITLIFFHFPIYTYIVGIVILFIFFKVTRKYDLIKYLKKQIKARPSEKITNIVMSVKNTFIADNSKVIFTISLLASIILPLIIFSSPRILYEKVDGGYAVRYYAFGLTNFKTATIPATYKSENVIALRGNTFSNMPFLQEVNLPDTIVEIRGQAFKNNISLTKVNIPNNLEYLGGGAFYNCNSITDIELPDTLTYLGGEAFYGASSLKSIKLSNNLIEIRGNTFENCSSLESVDIPDSVRRIGGHAFYGNSNLSKVIFTENSQLNEIGSSAFRRCDSLYEITLPHDVYINERAFKESPTSVNYFESKKPIKNIITIPNDGSYKSISTNNYGNIDLRITDAKFENGYLQMTLHLSGGINKTIDIICNGSPYYIYNDFYIITNKYTYKPSTTTFNFYY